MNNSSKQEATKLVLQPLEDETVQREKTDKKCRSCEELNVALFRVYQLTGV